mmetsp:Transcript_10510/g.24373  ORF Transcript_10510/g.24373 Transcript_10510/m.24373 type:complete len:323 (+) Transcript_10510:3-971(+)
MVPSRKADPEPPPRPKPMSRAQAVAAPATRPKDHKVTWEWLSCAGLDAEEFTKALRFLERHCVKGGSLELPLLDFFASDLGSQVLQAYRARQIEPEPVPEAKLCGRQKIPAQVRHSDGHYFSREPKAKPKAKAKATQSCSAPPAAEQRPAKGPETGPPCAGRVESFYNDRGYGFLSSQAAPGQDIYFRPSDPISVKVGRECSFLLHYKDGNPRASSIEWSEVEDDAQTGLRNVGRIKSLGPKYGFITCDALARQDVYVDRRELDALGGCCDGQAVSFRLVQNAKGQPQARDVEVFMDLEDEPEDICDVETQASSTGPGRKYW